MLTSTRPPQAGSVTAEVPLPQERGKWQGIGSALVFGALLGALYGALMGLCVAGLLHATTRLNFDLHTAAEVNASDLASQYMHGALVGAGLGAVVLMFISGGLLLFLEGLQQAWQRR